MGPQTGYFQRKLNFSNDLYKYVISLPIDKRESKKGHISST